GGLSHAGAEKLRGSNAHDAVDRRAQAQSAVENRGIAAQTAFPERVTDDSDRAIVFICIVDFVEHPAKLRSYTQGLKVGPRYRLRVDRFGLTAAVHKAMSIIHHAEDCRGRREDGVFVLQASIERIR